MAKYKRKKTKKYILLFLISFIIIAISSISLIYYRLNQKLEIEQTIQIDIENNQSFNSILDTLNSYNILTPSFIITPVIKIYAKLTDAKMYSGSYKFTSTNTHLDVLFTIIRGAENNTVKITFPEGITVNTFAKILNKHIDINEDEFINLANSDSIIKYSKVPINNIEGYLFPATYMFSYSQNAHTILKILLDEQTKIWERDFNSQIDKTGMTKHQILTLASIIEAETPVIEERPRIAGVYLNRLKINMRLEADPTVQYALGHQRRVTFADLELNHKYNTYKNFGLPPGPINNPSKSSIDAALNPESHNFLFFVAVGDGSGRHNFSSNFAQHKRYVSEYRKNRKR